MLCSIKIGVFFTILGYETLFRTSLWHTTCYQSILTIGWWNLTKIGWSEVHKLWSLLTKSCIPCKPFLTYWWHHLYSKKYSSLTYVSRLKNYSKRGRFHIFGGTLSTLKLPYLNKIHPSKQLYSTWTSQDCQMASWPTLVILLTMQIS